MASVDRFSGSNSIAPFMMADFKILLSISAADKVPGRRCAAVVGKASTAAGCGTGRPWGKAASGMADCSGALATAWACWSKLA
ncbi:hypothetical protein D3C72_1934360 [compost metagenome]